VLLIDVTGSKQTLRTFADEVLPELRNNMSPVAVAHRA